MLRFAIPVVLSLAAITTGLNYHPSPFYSAASDSQIRFALENRYDDTGPGNKNPEYAYNTYTTLEEALLGYIDDPDTKLPDHERNRAVTNLFDKPSYSGQYKPTHEKQKLKRYYPKTVEEYTGYNEQKSQEQDQYSKYNPPKSVEIVKGYRQPQPHFALAKPKKYYPVAQNSGFQQFERDEEVAEPYRLQIVNQKQPFRASPVDDTYFLRNSEYQQAHDQFDPHPKYTYSYGVHAADTGDTKSAQETREGGTVRGYYSFIDPDGKLRTVRYTADDKQGFQATVEREFPAN